jgi:hypothetical protein
LRRDARVVSRLVAGGPPCGEPRADGQPLSLWLLVEWNRANRRDRGRADLRPSARFSRQ